MFVRIKTTPNSPRKSVQIVQSIRNGEKVSQKIVRYVGIAMDDYELEQLKQLAESIRLKLEADCQQFLISPEELVKMKSQASKQKESEADYKVDLKDIREEDRVISGIHDIYGKLFDELRCKTIIKNYASNKATVKMFKDIVLGRIANPSSKRATVELLEENFGIKLNLDRVYSMMDKINDEAIEQLNNLMYDQTKKLFQEKVDVIFFDCTTLYFESFKEDEFRKNGYSKDLKFNQPQVLLALMVTKEGLPIGYKAFSGDTYEGHTLIPSIKELKEQYKLDKIVFVADAGLLNKDNIAELDSLEENQLEYIVGARLKSLPKILKEQILDSANYSQEENGYMIGRFEYINKKLIVSYCPKRARKDAHDREKAIEKLKNKLSKIKDPKGYLSNYGYKKYLKIDGETIIELDEEKIAEDSKWDGLHGIITNSKNLTDKEALGQYRNLWQVEESFRVTKHDLKVRPVFHWKPGRVKAHIAISFVAYSLVRHLEYRVRLQYKKISPEKIRQALVNTQTSIIYDSKKCIRYGLPSRISQDAYKIYRLMGLNRTSTPYIIEKNVVPTKKLIPLF